MLGTGQSLSIQGQISGLRQLVNIRWFEPYFLDSDFSASIDLYDQLRVYNDFSQSSLGGSLSFGYTLVSPSTRAFLAYNLERTQVSTETTSTFFGTASATSVIPMRVQLFMGVLRRPVLQPSAARQPRAARSRS